MKNNEFEMQPIARVDHPIQNIEFKKYPTSTIVTRFIAFFFILLSMIALGAVLVFVIPIEFFPPDQFWASLAGVGGGILFMSVFTFTIGFSLLNKPFLVPKNKQDKIVEAVFKKIENQKLTIFNPNDILKAYLRVDGDYVTFRINLFLPFFIDEYNDLVDFLNHDKGNIVVHKIKGSQKAEGNQDLKDLISDTLNHIAKLANLDVGEVIRARINGAWIHHDIYHLNHYKDNPRLLSYYQDPHSFLVDKASDLWLNKLTIPLEELLKSFPSIKRIYIYSNSIECLRSTLDNMKPPENPSVHNQLRDIEIICTARDQASISTYIHMAQKQQWINMVFASMSDNSNFGIYNSDEKFFFRIVKKNNKLGINESHFVTSQNLHYDSDTFLTNSQVIPATDEENDDGSHSSDNIEQEVTYASSNSMKKGNS